MTEHIRLLKTWVDKMVSLQLDDSFSDDFFGGIMCPSCASIHGRCIDGMLPMLCIAFITKDKKYVLAAENLFWWGERNVTRPDGSYINDSNNNWRGTTVFELAQLVESKHYYGELLSEKTMEAINVRIKKAADFLYEAIDHMHPNINYYFGCGLALELAGKELENDSYREKAKKLMHKYVEYTDESGLIYGEGKPIDGVTKKGCRPIDIGYNVEESIPSMVLYSISAGDTVIKNKAMKLMRAHMNFFLPDGGWDNSIGSRNSKWTYWGSRTSDGCQLAYALLAKEDKAFGEVAYRNMLQYKACTHDGLLCGGPMYHESGEKACVHHTFTHAKALALCIAMGINIDDLSDEDAFNKLWHEIAVKRFNADQIAVIRDSNWYASVSTSDYKYCEASNITGGGIGVLWNRKTGPILAGTMTKYRLVEPLNMQIPQAEPTRCQTLRLVLKKMSKYIRTYMI